MTFSIPAAHPIWALKSLLLFCGALLSMGFACNESPNIQPNTSAMQSVENNPAVPTPPPGNLEVATLGGGCFWCVEAIYQELKGVVKVESGFSGGKGDDPSYRDVCSGLTGHAEVIQITFDSTVIKYRDILHIFFTVHDPTTLNRQGADAGTQYRSVIFYHSPEQERSAREVMQESQQIWDDPIVTEIAPFTKFFIAEKYHQDYYSQNTSQPYCSIVITPKVKKFREKYRALLKE